MKIFTFGLISVANRVAVGIFLITEWKIFRLQNDGQVIYSFEGQIKWYIVTKCTWLVPNLVNGGYSKMLEKASNHFDLLLP